MKRFYVVLMVVCLIVLTVQVAVAIEFNMFESAFRYNGTVSSSYSGLITTSITYSTTLSTPGVHNVALFVDPEIDEAINTYYNEFGAANGTLAAGQSWEIDEPGYVFGDIYTNFLAGLLDNSNGVTSNAPDDVSMALGWNFNLGSLQTAYLSFTLSEIMPTSGFYLEQNDPDSDASLYFSSTLRIEDNGTNPVPEPSTFILFGSAMAGLALFRKKMRKSA